MRSQQTDREALPDSANRLGLDGIEYVEYATPKPQALGQVLEAMGFKPVARHRSREVVLYRQGSMNLIINASPDDARVSAAAGGHPVLSAVAFRVRDARLAHQRCVDLGAWAVPAHADAMELNVPAIHGPGGSRFYFVDRYRDFSIYDIDFIPIPTVDLAPPALAGMTYFGLVQYIGMGRTADWLAFYAQMFGFLPIPDNERFGIMPSGTLLASPCGQFMWQLIEPAPAMEVESAPELLHRIGLGTPDVAAAVAALKLRGVEFVDAGRVHPGERGALTVTSLGSVCFELVHREG
jgi:4-hydroxyphenylpyruvate dioxygenase